MTYFETPDHAEAFYAGTSVATLDLIAADEEALYFAGQPHLEVEDRDLIPESFVAVATAQDHADLQFILDYEAHSLTL